MDEYQEIDDLLKAIDRQQRVTKLEQRIRRNLKPEQEALLDQKLKEIGSVASPASPEDIEDHTDQVREILKQFMVYVEENVPDATQEDLENFFFKVALNDVGLTARYEQEQRDREYIRARMKDLRGKERLKVEEYLASEHKFEPKRETEIEEGLINCSYGKVEDEHGYWHFVYNRKQKLISYYEVEAQLQYLYQKRMDLLKEELLMGTERAEVERILASAGYVPLGELERLDERTTVQRYGLQRGDRDIFIYRIMYNSKDEIKQKSFVRNDEI
ncbi:hypothetical protein MK805_08815 [Shimazuella sp. AN120528]|uniref:hypothetical protein n=1 Tax=Shimazuella soli TaxID=1892854 RepID=UPI001F10A192|nr:hypothetical protein [Shimazuella soli]MCH5585070.1 hypothetical protein [Shimazuella soli]